jgi:uncharacterized membrane protein
MLVGVICALVNFWDAIAGVQVPANVQSLLGLTLIPCTMVISVLVLHKQYDWAFQLGAALIVVGAVLGSNDKNSDSSSSGSGSGGGGQNAGASNSAYISYIIYGISNLPYAYQYIVTEQFFEEGGGLWEMEVASGGLEILFSVCFAPLQYWALQSIGQTPQSFNWSDGWACLAGKDPDCGLGWMPALVLLMVCLSSWLNDIAYLCLVKFGNAAMMSVADAFSVPLINVFMSFKVMGRFQEYSGVWNSIGCVVCTAGMCVWAYAERELERKTQSQMHMHMQQDHSDYADADVDSLSSTYNSVNHNNHDIDNIISKQVAQRYTPSPKLNSIPSKSDSSTPAFVASESIVSSASAIRRANACANANENGNIAMLDMSPPSDSAMGEYEKLEQAPLLLSAKHDRIM